MMYKAKYSAKRDTKKVKRTTTLLVSLVLLVAMTAGATIAYLVANTSEVTNTFNPSEVTTRVTEDFDGKTKSNVKITNTGDTEAFIRAKVIVTWQNEAGNVYGQPVTADDYEVSYNEEGWIKGSDGYWYCKAPVAAKTNSAILISECKPKVEAPADEYYLCVEILCSGIQSTPESVVESVWGVTVENGVITAAK